MFELRDYQKDVITKALPILRESHFVYLTAEVRTGKTLMSLELCKQVDAKRVLFVTTRKTIDSKTIQNDHKAAGHTFELTETTYQSLHKISLNDDYDVLVMDEAHMTSAFPRASKCAKQCKVLKQKIPYTILLSGTATPETFSQIYYQLWGLENSPFAKFKTFYAFAREHVNITKQFVSQGRQVNNYKDAKPSVMEAFRPFAVSVTQKDAGFESEVDETIVDVPIDPRIHEVIKRLKRDALCPIGSKLLLADTGAKLLSKIHQLSSGTVKFEDDTATVLDTSKAEYIKYKWGHRKIAIFYTYKAELVALQRTLGDSLTTDIEEFELTDKSIALQVVSGRSGISLAKADCLVYYNISYSALNYWQSRDRLTTKDRVDNQVYYLFSDTGIERMILDTVKGKENFTTSHFEKHEQTTRERSQRQIDQLVA